MGQIICSGYLVRYPLGGMSWHHLQYYLVGFQRLSHDLVYFEEQLSTIPHADKIDVIENGRLVEAGTHKELLATNGYYRHVHSLQYGESTNEVAR